MSVGLALVKVWSMKEYSNPYFFGAALSKRSAVGISCCCVLPLLSVKGVMWLDYWQEMFDIRVANHQVGSRGDDHLRIKMGIFMAM
jgi:hypothetical protein